MANKGLEKKISAWLRGRNGSDELAICAILLALLLVVLNAFLRTFLLTAVALVLLAYAWWRMSSKDVEARENENGVFTEFLGPVRPWVRNPKAALAETRSYKHLKCPSCGQRMRVPRGKGRLRVRCPKCHEKFEART